MPSLKEMCSLPRVDDALAFFILNKSFNKTKRDADSEAQNKMAANEFLTVNKMMMFDCNFQMLRIKHFTI